MQNDGINEALTAKEKYQSAVESAYDYVEHFDLLETITNVGNDEVFTPRKTVTMMLDSLPEEVWHNPDYKWLNPATKNGVFEREIAIRLNEGLKDIIPDEETRKKHILQKMIYAYGQTKFTSNVARRTLYYCSQANRKCDGIKDETDGHYVNGYAIGNGSWFNDSEGNIKTPKVDHWFVGPKDKRKCKFCGIGEDSKYVDPLQREQYAYEFIHHDLSDLRYRIKHDFFEGEITMKFDIIIGNPPYQLSDGGAKASSQPIYQLFVNKAIELKPKYLSMIIPARWMAGGKGLDDFRKKMLEDKHISNLNLFLDSTHCFPNNDIRGGICYFLWDEKYDGMCNIYTHNIDGSIEKTKRYLKEENEMIDIFIKNEIQLSIVHKVLSFKEKNFSFLVSSRKPYGLATDFMQNQGKYNLPELSDNKIEGGLTIYGVDEKQKRIKKYATLDYPLPKRDLINDFKLFIPNAGGGGGKTIGETTNAGILSKPILAGPNDVCSETFLTIGPFDNSTQRDNCFKYISTKFFRALVGIRKNTQHTTSETYKFVPFLDFNREWTDEDLYKKYELTPDEISYIENNISKVDWDMKDFR